MKSIWNLISLLPENEFIHIGKETEDGIECIVATHFISPPKDGWINRSAYFMHNDGNQEVDPDFRYKFKNSCVYGVSVENKPENMEEFWRWIERDLTGRLKKLGILKEDHVTDYSI